MQGEVVLQGEIVAAEAPPQQPYAAEAPPPSSPVASYQWCGTNDPLPGTSSTCGQAILAEGWIPFAEFGQLNRFALGSGWLNTLL